jgi:predicted Zn-dependent protease
MRTSFAFPCVVLLAAAAIGYGEYRRADVSVSPEPLFHLLGDTQQELTRLPVRLTRLPDAEEVQIGDKIAGGYSNAWSSHDAADEAVAQRYVTEVGERVAVHARRRLSYKFHYIPDENFVNAFALPGGHVYIGQGLIEMLDSEDELAAVLGHEVEHVDLGHCAERVQFEARIRRLHLGELDELALIPYQIFAAGYSRQQELEADKDGTTLAVMAGYSPNGAVRLMQSFGRMEEPRTRATTPFGELTTVAQQSLEQYFVTHPHPDEREAQIEQLIASEGWPVRAERELQIEYLGLTRRAKAALARYDYPQAAALATRSLALRADQREALAVLYDASMFTADFSKAHEAARLLLPHSGGSVVEAQRLADSLAAQGGGKGAIRELAAAVRLLGLPVYESRLAGIDVAGLSLMAGDEGPMRQQLTLLTQEAQTPAQEASEHARAGLWFYRAGRYEEAGQQLGRARELNPEAVDDSLLAGWAALASNKMQTAETAFRAQESTEAAAGMAILEWRLERHESALDYAASLDRDPKWRNARWVEFACGKAAQKSLSDIGSERQKRQRGSK